MKLFVTAATWTLTTAMLTVNLNNEHLMNTSVKHPVLYRIHSCSLC